MDFQTGQVIEDSKKENRWKVTGVIQRKSMYSVLQVEDQTPELKRNLYLMVLNYSQIPGKDRSFEIRELRHSFYNMIEILCTNYTFMPEPMDVITFTNKQDPMDADLRENEPGLVFAQPAGFILPRQTKLNEKAWKEIKSTVISCVKTLKAIHDNKVVIRSLPIHTINLSRTTFKPYFFGFDTLIRMDEFKGYNPNKVCLSPDSVFSAPECFDSRGYLSPATDIYVLGKLVLQIILTERQFHSMIPPDDPFPFDIQNRINSLNLPPLWSRFLALALNPNPNQRFQNVTEADVYFQSGGATETVRTTPPTDSIKKPINKGPTTGPKKPWIYRPNRQLPSAAMVIWSGYSLTGKDEKFNFLELYQKFQYQYCFEPRLFFQFNPAPTDQDKNPFFQMLKTTYLLTPVLFQTKNQAEQVKLLFEHLRPESIRNLILVGNSGEYAVRKLFEHPDAKKWNIIWIRAGEGQAPIAISNLIDAKLFIRKKNKTMTQASTV